MSRNSDPPSEGFDELLAWLNPDRELAASIYVDLRLALVKIFAWNHCSDSEGMADETFDRVAKQVHRLRDSYEGDPKHFFYGVARNLMKEYKKTVKTHVAIEDVQPPSGPSQQQIEEESSELLEDCLQNCLGNLPREKRELILAYYAKQKQAKIDHRAEMARRLGISTETMRVRMCRIRTKLEKCIKHCLDERAARDETD